VDIPIIWKQLLAGRDFVKYAAQGKNICLVVYPGVVFKEFWRAIAGRASGVPSGMKAF
jgi:hypothetical protein